MRHITTHHALRHRLWFLAKIALRGNFKLRAWRLHDHRRDIRVAHQLVERRHVGLHDLPKLLELRVDLRRQLIIDCV